GAQARLYRQSEKADAVPFGQGLGRGQAVGAVVVAGDDDDAAPPVVRQACEGVVIELLGRGGRVDGVEDVAGDEDELDALIVRDGAKFVDEGFLFGQPVPALQRPSQMPVGRVQYAHEGETPPLVVGERTVAFSACSLSRT